jgi:Lon protease-like protein
MQRPSLIPLFPLDVVLLPAMVLPLHIFEPRYKAMIGRCLSEKIEFGMVLASNQAIAPVGCTAEITRKIKDYPDGRMDILTEGRSVFRLAEMVDRKEYYEGNVEYLPDEPFISDAQQQVRLADLFEKCHALMFGQPWGEADSTDANLLAYRMAAQLPVELEQRQALLEMRKENERREFLLGWLRKFLPKLAERDQTRKRAAGNGNALN